MESSPSLFVCACARWLSPSPMTTMAMVPDISIVVSQTESFARTRIRVRRGIYTWFPGGLKGGGKNDDRTKIVPDGQRQCCKERFQCHIKYTFASKDRIRERKNCASTGPLLGSGIGIHPHHIIIVVVNSTEISPMRAPPPVLLAAGLVRASNPT